MEVPWLRLMGLSLDSVITGCVQTSIIVRAHRVMGLVESKGWEARTLCLCEVVDAKWSSMFECCVLHPALSQVRLFVGPIHQGILPHSIGARLKLHLHPSLHTYTLSRRSRHGICLALSHAAVVRLSDAESIVAESCLVLSVVV